MLFLTIVAANPIAIPADFRRVLPLLTKLENSTGEPVSFLFDLGLAHILARVLQLGGIPLASAPSRFVRGLELQAILVKGALNVDIKWDTLVRMLDDYFLMPVVNNIFQAFNPQFEEEALALLILVWCERRGDGSCPSMTLFLQPASNNVWKLSVHKSCYGYKESSVGSLKSTQTWIVLCSQKDT